MRITPEDLHSIIGAVPTLAYNTLYNTDQLADLMVLHCAKLKCIENNKLLPSQAPPHFRIYHVASLFTCAITFFIQVATEQDPDVTVGEIAEGIANTVNNDPVLTFDYSNNSWVFLFDAEDGVGPQEYSMTAQGVVDNILTTVSNHSAVPVAMLFCMLDEYGVGSIRAMQKLIEGAEVEARGLIQNVIGSDEQALQFLTKSFKITQANTANTTNNSIVH